MKINNSLQLNNSSLLSQKKQNVSFGSSVSAAESLGKSVLKDGFLSRLNKHIEFHNGADLPFTVFLAVLFGAVLGCRAIAARDKDERREILTRDSITVGTLVFARPPLKKAFALLSKNRTGLALSIKPEGHNALNGLKKFLNYLKPNDGVRVMTSPDIISKYNVKGYKNGFGDLLQFVKKEDGDIKKMIKKTKGLEETVKKAFDSLKPGVKYEDASADKLIEVFTQGHKTETSDMKALYDLLNGDKNPLVKKAKTINSYFDFATTFAIVPALLGFGLPKLLEKQMKESRMADVQQKKETPAQEAKLVFNAFNSTSNSKAFQNFTGFIG